MSVLSEHKTSRNQKKIHANYKDSVKVCGGVQHRTDSRVGARVAQLDKVYSKDCEDLRTSEKLNREEERAC